MLLAVLLNFGVIGSLRTWYIHIERCIGCFHLRPCPEIMVPTAFLGAGQSAEGLQTVAFSPHRQLSSISLINFSPVSVLLYVS